MKRSASAIWSGDLKSGNGEISTESGALKSQPYGFNTRFGDKPGTNPEELIGAAHAGCFSMALSAQLGEAGIKPERIQTKAVVTLEKLDDGYEISAVALDLVAKIPGVDKQKFEEIANKAKAGCPVSKLLNAEITLTMKLDT